MNIVSKYIMGIITVFLVCTAVALVQPSQSILVFGMGGTICAVFITGLTQATQSEKTVQQTKQVAKTLAESTQNTTAQLETTKAQLTNLTVVASDTHKLVNSAMGRQLFLGAELARWKANQTKNPLDEKAAVAAENELMEHMNKQKLVDNRLVGEL